MYSQFKDGICQQSTIIYEEMIDAPLQEKETRFNVYRNNVTVSLVDTLSEIFPVTQAAVGDAFFRDMAKRYLREQLPRSPVLSEYGESFADFVRQFEPASSLPFLSDLTSLEYTLLRMTHDEDVIALNNDEVATEFAKVTDPSELILHLPSVTQLLVSPLAIGSLYQAFYSHGKQTMQEVNVYQDEYLLLSKSGLYAQLQVIDYGQALFLKQLLKGKPLVSALPTEETFDLGSTLAKLIEWQLLTKIELPSY